MIIEGFRKSDHAQLQEHAFQLAEAWLKVNYLVYKKTGHMYEKVRPTTSGIPNHAASAFQYNVTDTTYQPGGGGEHEVVVGFGWSNGVVLDLLRTYGARLVAPDNNNATRPRKNHVVSYRMASDCGVRILVVSMIAYMLGR